VGGRDRLGRAGSGEMRIQARTMKV